MKVIFDILRRETPDSEPYRQVIEYEYTDARETVATALTHINRLEGLSDSKGRPVTHIEWECSCMQKRCGACAMLVNGRPQLACDSFLDVCSKNGCITLEPLSKFRCLRDLVVDRSALRESLKKMKAWAGKEGTTAEKKLDDVYDASKCLQCGCCLEVCPNYVPGESFAGAAGFVAGYRSAAALKKEDRQERKAAYNEHVYKDCAKSLSCKDICPAKIDTDRILSRSNALLIWNRK